MMIMSMMMMIRMMMTMVMMLLIYCLKVVGAQRGSVLNYVPDTISCVLDVVGTRHSRQVLSSLRSQPRGVVGCPRPSAQACPSSLRRTFTSSSSRCSTWSSLPRGVAGPAARGRAAGGSVLYMMIYDCCVTMTPT